MSKALEIAVEHIELKDSLQDMFYTGIPLGNYVLEELQKGDHDKIIKYPYPVLNKTLKGLFPTSFLVIGADTGCGKSELLGHIAHHACIQGRRAVYFDFENDDGDFFMRQLCKKISIRTNKEYTVADLRLEDINNGSNKDMIYEETAKLSDELKDVRVYKNRDLPTVDHFVEILEKMDDVDLVCVDHLHYFDFESTNESHAIQISKVMRALRGLTKKRIPIILASHLKERKTKDKKPSNFDLFGSSNIAKEAKSVILIHREEGKTIFQITKNRDGQSQCLFEAEFNRVRRELDFPEQPGFQNVTF